MARKRAAQGSVMQFNEMALRNNVNVLEYSRTCQAAVAGCAAGIIGLTGIQGFVFYVVTSLLLSAIWYVKSAAQPTLYFGDKSVFVTHSFVGGLFTYILFWTFLYGMVHVY